MDGIEVRNLTKSYEVDRRRLDVLKGINLCLEPGEITILLGRSGCGKTTLLRLVGGLESCDSGEVIYHSQHKTAFVFQEPRLMPWLDVKGNVAFGLHGQKEGKKSETAKTETAKTETRHMDDKVRAVIRLVGLGDFEHAYPAQLSGGMQQRTAIARALAYEPSFILMDEPFAALDYFTREQMQREVIRVQKEEGSSILFVTHSIDEALILGHKIVVMKDGKVHAQYRLAQDDGKRDLMDERLLNMKQDILKDIGQ